MFGLVFHGLLLLLGATGAQGFSASTSTPLVKVKENEGADLKCSYSGNFGSEPRVEWKFQDNTATQMSLVIYQDKPTDNYVGRVVQYNGGIRFNSVTRKDSGTYICSVAGNGYSADAKITLIVLVPPSTPECYIPTSVQIDTNVKLTCSDSQASPPPIYKWYKNKEPLPVDPSRFPDFRNMSYKLNPTTGTLVFSRVSQSDEGDYFCESTNEAGPPKQSQTTRMAVYGVNMGGIAAGVIILLILLVLLIVGLWFAHRKGYLTKVKERVSGSSSRPQNSAVYRPTSDHGDGDDGSLSRSPPLWCSSIIWPHPPSSIGESCNNTKPFITDRHQELEHNAKPFITDRRQEIGHNAFITD